jgi:hypothetical protein
MSIVRYRRPEKNEPGFYAPKRPMPEPLDDDQVAATRFSKEEPVTDDLNALIQRVSAASVEEIDRVILELHGVRNVLRQEADRIECDIAAYASLNHAVMSAMKIISGNLARWNSG